MIKNEVTGFYILDIFRLEAIRRAPGLVRIFVGS